MEEQEQHTDRFLRTEKIENVKKKSKLFFRTMPYLSAYLCESLDFFKVGIFQKMNNIQACVREVVEREIIIYRRWAALLWYMGVPQKPKQKQFGELKKPMLSCIIDKKVRMRDSLSEERYEIYKCNF